MNPAMPGTAQTAAALEQSELFTRWRDPVSGVESFILNKRRAAPLQLSFYFVNSGFSDDGRFLWMYCAFPPGGDAYYGRQLAVADFERQTVRHFPETQFMDASPYVDAATGEVYWTTGLEVWKRGPLPGDTAAQIGAFPAELARNRRPLRIATHLSRSADGRAFAIDAQIGADWFAGELPLATGGAVDAGAFRLWRRFDICHNHAQLSPVDPGLMLIAQDGWNDPTTGEEGVTRDRLWLLRRDGALTQLVPDDPLPSSLRGHEWWDAGGEHVWYIDYRRGTAKINLRTGRRELVWPNGHTHSHCDRAGRWLAGDANPDDGSWRVLFFNIKTGREIGIVSKLPPLDRRPYHVHPHPRFCLHDRYICYTTNVLGTVDVAITSVEQLAALTS
ncbi:oligogalacturonate lyase family protein [Termitidicoccus mucosus]|uniref:Oligogalacturonate lyase domain-containing protein n=1 Tax=Termitidicoccus mucosus TaxID=1184151 RepID=A0A178IDY7_9BACT|nr:hypothetical protein AW736_18245 [Opitutaceae bacterium TSB47]